VNEKYLVQHLGGWLGSPLVRQLELKHEQQKVVGGK